MKYSLIIFLMFMSGMLLSQSEVRFPSEDGILIRANLYPNENKDAKVILLCHQARFSRGEYIETAPKLVKMGYICMAIDQRSGDSINGVINETKLLAAKQGKGTDFADAEQDIRSALHFLYAKFGKKVILVGSSYSSSLVLKIASEEPEKVECVISFSPGEYFKDPKMINNSLKKLELPVFITCSKEEIKRTTSLLDGVLNKKLVYFKPKEEGKHGSKALWENNPDHQEYWDALKKFLKSN